MSVLRPPAPPRAPTRWLPRDAIAGVILGAGLLLVALPVLFLGILALIALVWTGGGESDGGGAELLAFLAVMAALAGVLLSLPVLAVRFYQGPPPGERRVRLVILGVLGLAVTVLCYGGLLGRVAGLG
jgi:hypothetical protein